MESQYYKNLEIMKQKYKSDAFLNEYLEKISILMLFFPKNFILAMYIIKIINI